MGSWLAQLTSELRSKGSLLAKVALDITQTSEEELIGEGRHQNLWGKPVGNF